MGRQLRCASPSCRRKFTPARATHRKYCFECRPPRRSSTGTLATAPARAGVEHRESGPVESATIAELERAERLQSVAGQVSVRLARDLDSAALTGSQASSLSAQLLKTMAAATGGAPPEPDEIDEFTRRAREKRASA